MIDRALTEAGGNRAEAARRLGIHRQLLHAKITRSPSAPSADRTAGVRKPDEQASDD